MRRIQEQVCDLLNARCGTTRWVVRSKTIVCCYVDGHRFHARIEYDGGRWWTYVDGRCVDLLAGIDRDDPRAVADAVWSSFETWRAAFLAAHAYARRWDFLMSKARM